MLFGRPCIEDTDCHFSVARVPRRGLLLPKAIAAQAQEVVVADMLVGRTDKSQRAERLDGLTHEVRNRAIE